jgi:hypothetical protein
MLHGRPKLDGELAMGYNYEADHPVLRAPGTARKINKEADMITM